jgi:hypothetical protein
VRLDRANWTGPTTSHTTCSVRHRRSASPFSLSSLPESLYPPQARPRRSRHGRWLERGGSPDPIPNSEVKPRCADGTAGATRWESTALPAYLSQSPAPHTRGAGDCASGPHPLVCAFGDRPSADAWARATEGGAGTTRRRGRGCQGRCGGGGRPRAEARGCRTATQSPTCWGSRTSGIGARALSPAMSPRRRAWFLSQPRVSTRGEGRLRAGVAAASAAGAGGSPEHVPG